MAAPRSLRPIPTSPRVPALEDRAIADVRFIRETMERAQPFTAVPGWGEVAIGLTALVAAFVATRQETTAAWLATWLTEAVVALAIAGWAMHRKARRVGRLLLAGPGGKTMLGLAPPLAAGAALTVALAGAGHVALLPGLWLLLYGCGVVTGGAFSVRIVPVMGLCFMLLGGLALLGPATGRSLGSGDGWLALGFGGLHVGFGVAIARKHGG